MNVLIFSTLSLCLWLIHRAFRNLVCASNARMEIERTVHQSQVSLTTQLEMVRVDHAKQLEIIFGRSQSEISDKVLMHFLRSLESNLRQESNNDVGIGPGIYDPSRPFEQEGASHGPRRVVIEILIAWIAVKTKISAKKVESFYSYSKSEGLKLICGVSLGAFISIATLPYWFDQFVQIVPQATPNQVVDQKAEMLEVANIAADGLALLDQMKIDTARANNWNSSFARHSSNIDNLSNIISEEFIYNSAPNVNKNKLIRLMEPHKVSLFLSQYINNEMQCLIFAKSAQDDENIFDTKENSTNIRCSSGKYDPEKINALALIDKLISVDQLNLSYREYFDLLSKSERFSTEGEGGLILAKTHERHNQPVLRDVTRLSIEANNAKAENASRRIAEAIFILLASFDNSDPKENFLDNLKNLLSNKLAGQPFSYDDVPENLLFIINTTRHEITDAGIPFVANELASLQLQMLERIELLREAIRKYQDELR